MKRLKFKTGLWGVLFALISPALVQGAAPDIAAIKQGDFDLAEKAAKKGGSQYVNPFREGMKNASDQTGRKKMRKAYLLLLNKNVDAEDVKEEDVNSDGEKDQWTFSKKVKGEQRPLLVIRDTNNDLMPNREIRFQNGQKTEAEEDTNGDLKYDIHEVYQNGAMVKKSQDKDHDGSFDLVEKFKEGRLASREDYENETLTRKQYDKNGDGTFDQRENYSAGVMVHAESDDNHDGKMDFIREYENGVMVSAKKDEDFDGIFNVFSKYSGGVLQSQKIDRDNDGTPDEFVKVSDKNQDQKVDFWEYRDAANDLVKTGKDTNLDEKEDAWSFYESGKIFQKEFDQNADSRVDKREHLNPDGQVVKIEYDMDLTDDYFTFDKFEFFANNLLTRREWDCDKESKWDCTKDSKIDKIEYFDPGENLVKVGYDTKGMDGELDYWEHFSHNRLVKKEFDKNLDGRPDYSEVLGAKGKVAGIEEDTDFDGKIDKFTFSDKWSYLNVKEHFDRDVFYRNKDLDIWELDRNNNGVMDQWEYYNKAKRKLKVERDKNEDGKIDEWIYYDKWEYYGAQEKIVKTRIDKNGDEVADAVRSDDPLAYYLDNVYTDYTKTVEQLILDLQYGVSQNRITGAARLAKLVKMGTERAKDGFTALVKTLHDPREEVVIAAINALGDFGDARALSPLSKHVKKITPNVNLAAIDALASLGKSEALPHLFGFLALVKKEIAEIKKSDKPEEKEERDQMNELITRTFKAFTAISDNQAVPEIIPYLKDYFDKEVRIAAVKALGHFLDDRAIKPMGDRIQT